MTNKDLQVLDLCCDSLALKRGGDPCLHMYVGTFYDVEASNEGQVQGVARFRLLFVSKCSFPLFVRSIASSSLLIAQRGLPLRILTCTLLSAARLSNSTLCWSRL